MLPRQSRTRRATLPLLHPDMPTLGPAFEHADDAARYAHEKIGNRRDREYGGFILLRRDNKYVPTEPIPGTHFEFDPNDVFPRNDAEGYVFYPHGHDDYAVYHSHPSTPAGLDSWSEREKVVYQNGFSVADIYAVIDERELSPASYLSGPDGSLIKYLVRDSRAQADLFRRVSGPQDRPYAVQDSELHQALLNSQLLPSDVVRLLAGAGDLRIVVGSALWGRPGKVSAHWQPYPPRPASPPRVCKSIWPPRPLVVSRAFASADLAARYVHEQIIEERAANRPHSQIIGYLLKNPTTGAYIAGEPMADAEALYAPCSVFHPDAYYRPGLPSGFHIDGLYFSPGTAVSGQAFEEVPGAGFFQPEDLHRVFEYRYVPARRPAGKPVRYGFTMSEVYLCAADGALLGYTPSKTAAEYELARRLSPSYSGPESIARQLAAGSLKHEDYIRLVAAAGRLRVLVAGGDWPEVGDVRGN
jgi:hypothetical protein